MAAPGEAAAVAAPSQPEMAAGSAASAVVLPERLQRREAERQQGVERQRQKKEAQVVKEEQSEFFLAAFAREREAVEALLAAGTLEEAAARLQALQKLLTGSVRFLAPYEVRQGQETVARLQGDLAARRQQLQPKKKFGSTPSGFPLESRLFPLSAPASLSHRNRNGVTAFSL
uniref:Tubulin-specific chaperone C N-terminal domain-containing protein n=1 Tax=Zonotrichia albicollis TaxID=44394 RepID=A0A8D2M726_ZONAL